MQKLFKYHVSILKNIHALMHCSSLGREMRFLVRLFMILHQQEFPSRISLRLPAKDHRTGLRKCPHAFSCLLPPPHRFTLIFAYELPDSPRHPRWLQVIHLPTQKLVRLLRRFEKYRGKKVTPRRDSCFPDAVVIIANCKNTFVSKAKQNWIIYRFKRNN